MFYRWGFRPVVKCIASSVRIEMGHRNFPHALEPLHYDADHDHCGYSCLTIIPQRDLERATQAVRSQLTTFLEYETRFRDVCVQIGGIRYRKIRRVLSVPLISGDSSRFRTFSQLRGKWADVFEFEGKPKPGKTIKTQKTIRMKRRYRMIRRRARKTKNGKSKNLEA